MGQLALAFETRMRGAVTSQSVAAEAGRARRVAKVRAEMMFDIDHSLAERAFDGSHVDHLPERLLVRCDDDHGMSLTPTSNSAHTDRKKR